MPACASVDTGLRVLFEFSEEVKFCAFRRLIFLRAVHPTQLAIPAIPRNAKTNAIPASPVPSALTLAATDTGTIVETSTDWAMRSLGGGAWKFLHYSSYIIFYMVVLHTAYFLYIHFTMSFHRPPPPDANWAQIPFAILTVGVIGLQAWAFVATVRRRRISLGRVAPT